jgi:methionyl-tRNA formyltransferase
MPALKSAFIGCVDISEAVFGKLMTMPEIALAGVVTRRASPANADFRSLEPLARKTGKPVFLVDSNDQQEIAKFLRELAPELIFCVGWSYLLKPEILAIPPRSVIGYHPTALPHNRGRHPLIWALALGLTETGSTFFLMDEGADSGPILSQRRLPIAPEDDAGSLYARMIATALAQLEELVPALVDGTARPVPQDHSQANVWRKRGREDGRIDWRMDAAAIRNLVRALTKPYVGAHCATSGKAVPVWKAEIGPPAPANLEPGRVIEVRGRDILVKCYAGSVRLTEHEFDPLPALGSSL